MAVAAAPVGNAGAVTTPTTIVAGTPSPARRATAALALLLVLAVLVEVTWIAVSSFPGGLVIAVLLVCGVIAAYQAARSRGSGRAVKVVVAIALILTGLVGLVIAGLVLELVVLAVLVAALAATLPRCFEPVAHLRPAPRPRRPVVIYNPKSGGGKAITNHLADEAAKRGIEAVELQPGDDLVELVNDAVTRGADALAAAGGDGTQALVATIAAAHDLPFACIPAGTRNHFALDLGVDRNDVVGALDAFVDGAERVVDLAEVNGRVFVNNASLGVYASAVQRDEYRDAKISTLLDTVPDVIGTEHSDEAELQWPGPDGRTHGSTAVLLVSNNPYRIGRLFGNGTRPRLDTGTLGVIATREGHRSDDGARSHGLWSSWSCPEFTVDADRPVPIGVDGEALVMDPPLRFTVRPGALRVRIAPQHPGGSPSSGAPSSFGDAIRDLLRTVAGRPPTADE